MNEDNLDALRYSLEQINLHKCPNCGHKYPNYHYYGYLEDFYICPECNHKERVKDNIKEPGIIMPPK